VHAADVSTAQVPLEKQQAPVGQSVPLQVVPPPSHVPLRLAQSAAFRPRQLPLTKQHAPTGCGQLADAQSVPSPRYVPPPPVQVVAVTTWQVPLVWQQAPAPGVQFTPDQVVRITQSPVGRQNPGSALNVAQPPLAGHPNAPQFNPNSQFFVGCDRPLTSTTGKALQQVGGPTRHGSCVC
jgi:hypothetical protein